MVAHVRRAWLRRPCWEGAIEVRFFDGEAADAFVLAVRTNIAHGLPLSRADRTAAAERIVRSHPHWSDRMIASNTGLSPKTVGAMRRRSTGDVPQPNVRIGIDGRKRRVGHVRSHPTGPAAAAETTAPDAVGTQRPVGRRNTSPPLTVVEKHPGLNRAELIQSLRRDPSLRYSETGRALLRLLDLNLLGSPDWDQLGANVPPHCADQVAAAALACARAWHAFAGKLSVSETGPGE